MKKIFLTLFLLTITSCLFAETNQLWQQVDAKQVATDGKRLLFPNSYLIYSVDAGQLVQQLFSTPYNADSAKQIVLPMPDGSQRIFLVWQTHIMESLLEAKYSSIKTFTAYAANDPRVTAKIDMTSSGFHAMIFNGDNTSFVDPYTDVNDGYYICYYKRDFYRPVGERMRCAVGDVHNIEPSTPSRVESGMRLTTGTVLRKYRLALACTGEYSQVVAGSVLTKANVLSAMITSVNRVNGVYERELAVTLQLVNNEDTIIFLVDTGTGAYANFNVFTAIAQNQDTLDRRIGTANYDIGHVFTTGTGGYAQIGSVCFATQKAQGTSGIANPVGDAFDIDYVVHEMGHQLGAYHTFNDNVQGACNSNAELTEAYEPGSGSTIMAYAGICTDDNIQPHSNDYFHAVSLNVIHEDITTIGAVCGITVPTGNKPAYMPPFTASYNIPYLTPFEFTAPSAMDSVVDSINTYCWEEWDLGDFGATFANTHASGPIFRSFNPDTSRTRIFPTLRALVNDTTNYLGEKLPDVARNLNFKLTVRSIYKGIGSINIPDDSILLHVINTSKPFKVTNPDTPVKWLAKSNAIVTWDVASTNASPINCDSVNIFLSVDGGYTYPYLLASVPNNGTAGVQVPDVITRTARVKVKGKGNVFFDISDKNFSVDTILYTSSISIYPIPAGKNSGNIIYVNINNSDQYQMVVYDAIGKSILKGEVSGRFSINAGAWARGVYIMRLRNEKTHEGLVQKTVVE